MVGNEFNVAYLVLQRCAKLYMPPFTRSKAEGKGRSLNQAEIRKTKEIASLWVHVERAIGRLKTFKILSNTIDTKLVPLVDQILAIVAVLCNFEPHFVESRWKGEKEAQVCRASSFISIICIHSDSINLTLL